MTIAGDRVGKWLVKGKYVTGFTDGEKEVGLTKVVPFPVDDEMMSLGATFYTVTGAVHTVADGQLITSQNPALSGPTAEVLNNLNKTKWPGSRSRRGNGILQRLNPHTAATAGFSIQEGEI